MAHILGYWTGAALFAAPLIFLLSLAWDFILLKRVTRDPLSRKLGSVAVAYVTIASLFSLGGNGWIEFILCLPPAIILAYFAARKGFEMQDQPGVEEVFW